MRVWASLATSFLLAATLCACGVGPGTPLFEAMNPGQETRSGTVQPPDGYGPPKGTIESQGLINNQQRKETAEYLKSLANEGESVQAESRAAPSADELRLRR